MKKSFIAKWIIENKVPAFLLLTFIFTWSFYLLLYLVKFQSTHVVSRFCLIAAFGPSLSSIFISRFTEGSIKKQKHGKQFILFLIVFIIAGLIEWTDHIVWKHNVTTLLVVLDLVMVSLAAFVISNVFSGSISVRNLLKGLMQWRIGAGWLLLSLALWPVMILFSNFLTRTLGFEVASPASYEPAQFVLLAVESFFWYLLFGGPLNEEPGWRGFMLNDLQQRYNPLKSSIIIGVFWGLWHVPLHLLGYFPYGALGAVIRIFDIPTAIIFTWLFNRTKGSLLPVLFLHSSRNTTSLFLPRHFLVSNIVWTLLALFAVVLDKMWHKRKLLTDQNRNEQISQEL
jgi:membrane protease YdiL (CAAX protease family)